MAALFLGGLGASTQHPLASALMAHAFAGERSMKALGTSNFAGDIGKMTVPAAASLLLLVMSWRPALALLGALGLLAAVAVFLLTPRYRTSSLQEKPTRQACRHRSLPVLLCRRRRATRSGFALFLPFVLTAKGVAADRRATR